jgi:predicted Zn-dependent protease
MRWFLFFILCAACSHNPVTGKTEVAILSESQEISLGGQVYPVMQKDQGGLISDAEVQTYVQNVGYKLVEVSDRPYLPYEFVVLDNSVPNAWALPGGKIAINRGLLVELESEAELAAVLAHEIVHSSARHGAKSMERSVLFKALIYSFLKEDLAHDLGSLSAEILSLKYSRSAELEADDYGIKYMVLAGYDPEAAVSLQKKFLRLAHKKKHNWLDGLFATHPPSQERIAANESHTHRYPQGGFQGKEEYQKIIARLEKNPKIE